MKRILCLTILTGVSFFTFAQKYKISEIEYNIEGKTKQRAIERTIKIDKNKTFNDLDELDSYIEELSTLFMNERNFESSKVDFEILRRNSEATDSEDSFIPVKLSISTKDSKHLLIFPYPKYDSNTGFAARIRMRDSNFCGSLNTLNMGLVYDSEKSEDDENKTNHKFGALFDYVHPFSIGKIEASWNNVDSVYYTLHEDKPEYDLNTGFTFTLPVNRVAFVLDVMQGIESNASYKKYDDETYGKTNSKFSIPVTLAQTKKYGKIQWGPYVSESANYDLNGINEKNEDLTSPIVFGGHEFKLGQVNWVGNFRDGVIFTIDNGYGYNFHRDEFIPKIAAELTFFKAVSNAGINSRIRGFAMDNMREDVTSRLRGIVDKSYYTNYVNDYGERTSASKTEMGIVCNFDFPVHIYTTNFGKIFDFELQAAPFIDFALVSNPKTGKTFAFEDGYYSAGMEFLVYPLKWRSIVVRGSAGIDLSRWCNFSSGTNDVSDPWNNKVKNYEIFIGIGWHY